MNPGRILIGQVGIVLIVIVLTQWLATQWTAEALGVVSRIFRTFDHATAAPWG